MNTYGQRSSNELHQQKAGDVTPSRFRDENQPLGNGDGGRRTALERTTIGSNRGRTIDGVRTASSARNSYVSGIVAAAQIASMSEPDDHTLSFAAIVYADADTAH